MPNSDCPICFIELDKTDYYKLSCSHLICKNCFPIFKRYFKTCCLCRKHYYMNRTELIRFLPSNYNVAWSSLEEYLLIDLYLDSITIEEIAKRLQKTKRGILLKLGKLKNTQFNKLDELRKQRLSVIIKKEKEEEDLRQEELDRVRTIKQRELSSQNLFNRNKLCNNKLFIIGLVVFGAVIVRNYFSAYLIV